MKKLLFIALFIADLFCIAEKINAQMIFVPDSFFRARLVSLGYGSCIVGDSIDSTCPLIQNVTSLTIDNDSIQSIEGISAFPLLHSLNCNSNRLTSLPALPDTLRILWCAHNKLVSIPPLPRNLVQLLCDYNQISIIAPLPPHISILSCNSNYLASLPDLPDTMSILYCENNPGLTCLPKLGNIYYLHFDGCPITCVPNYGNVKISTPGIDFLPLCNLFNTNGCDFFWNISGKTFLDLDGDCTQLQSEMNLKNLHFKLFQNGNLIQQVISTRRGIFSFAVDSPGVYEVRLDTTNIPFSIECPSSENYIDTISPVDTLFINNDFALKCKSEVDLGIWAIIGQGFNPGKRSTIHVAAGEMTKRFGVTCASGISGSLTININGNAHYFGPAVNSILPSSVIGNTITYTIADFGLINISTDFGIEVLTDTNATFGSTVCISALLTTSALDYNLLNNSDSICFPVKSSFDPNNKLVFPEEVIDTSQHWLTYTINFQNTGNATAEHIYILDTLSNYIDVSTFQLLEASHPSFVQILENNIARFNFPGINLPDSNSNEPLSHGYVQYKVKLKDNLPPGTQVHNTAYIYFDFNAPVITNTTSNTIDVVNGITEQEKSPQLKIGPVPFENNLIIQTDAINSHYSIVNIFGSEIKNGKINSSQMKINSELWTPGIYFLRIDFKSGSIVSKLIKE